MQIWAKRVLGVFVLATFLGAVAGGSSFANAEPKMKSKRAEGRFMEFDSEAKTILVKVKGKKTTFNVKPEGSVLTRTSVAVNGRKGELTDIPAGKTVLIYWVLDEAQPTLRFARKIDVIFSAEELAERYGFED